MLSLRHQVPRRGRAHLAAVEWKFSWRRVNTCTAEKPGWNHPCMKHSSLICLFQVSVAFDGRIELTNTMFPRQVGPDVHDQKKWLILPKWQPPHCQVGKRKQTLVNYLGNEPVVWVKRVHEHFATDRHPMPILLPIVHSVATMQCGLWCIWQHQICVNADHVFYFQTDKLLPTPLQSPSQTDNDVNKE